MPVQVASPADNADDFVVGYFPAYLPAHPHAQTQLNHTTKLPRNNRAAAAAAANPCLFIRSDDDK